MPQSVPRSTSPEKGTRPSSALCPRGYTRLDIPGSVFHITATGSTQDDMALAWRDGELSPLTALVADAQSAGRGRIGRPWYSAPERSLTVSALVYLPETLEDALGWLTLAGGAAARAAFADLTGSSSVHLSWPNDVVVGENPPKKLAGVLGEYLGRRHGRIAAVLGLGANLALGADELPTPTATSLAGEGLPVPSRNAAIGAWLPQLERRLDALVNTGSPVASGLLDEVNRTCITLRPGIVVGRPRDTPVRGTGTRITPDGSLVVLTDRGEVTVTSGEVSLFGMEQIRRTPPRDTHNSETI